ncbi:MAG TPA: MCE family protein [Mycobacteriales bacterium]|nr:MCE family protein [Mycobacteriales bacterium]
MVATAHRSGPATAGRLHRVGRRAGRPALGLAFLLVLAALLGLSVAVYDKAFTPVVPVTLRTDHVGNQLRPNSDVKLRGIVVGRVRRISSNGSGARVDLALDPDQIGLIPSDVRARLLPKTLFGERYVALVIPPGDPSAGHLRAHDVIGQDRSSAAIELERVLSDVLPLLRTIRPAELDATLSALSTALSGRGAQLGRTLTQLDSYLDGITPSLPALITDVRGLADTADVYSAAAGDLLDVLGNLRTTAGTIVRHESQLRDLLTSTTGLAGTARAVLTEDAQRIIGVSAASRPVLDLLARYAPEYPCLLAGLAEQEPTLENVFGGAQPGLHLTLEVIRDRGGYTPGEQPRYLAHSGPDCHGLPARPAGNFDPGGHIPDGSAPSGQGTLGRADSGAFAGSASGAALLGVADTGVQGSVAERRWVDALVAPTLGVSPDRVPDTAELLFAPMARGTEVHLS